MKKKAHWNYGFQLVGHILNVIIPNSSSIPLGCWIFDTKEGMRGNN